MSIKIEVIKKSIAAAEKRLKKVDDLLNAKPLSEICNLREQAAKIVEEHKGDYKKIAELIDPLAKKEKKLFAIAKKQTSTTDLVDQKVALESELYQLRNELFYAEQKAS